MSDTAVDVSAWMHVPWAGGSIEADDAPPPQRVRVRARDGAITDVVLAPIEEGAKPGADDEFVAPGFVDVQFNGAWGVDFSTVSVTAEEIRTVARRLPSHGVTSCVPTLVSSSKETYAHALAQLMEVMDAPPSGAARVLGVHLEGPLMAMERIGAHLPAHVRAANDALARMGAATSSCVRERGHVCACVRDRVRALLAEVYSPIMLDALDKGRILLVTIAPELPGALDVIAYLKSARVCVCLGHTDGTLEHMQAGFAAGADMVTHMFNAMRPFSHRAPGPIGALAERIPSEDAHAHAHSHTHTRTCVLYSIIADGVHVHPSAIRMAARCNPHGMLLVTDAMRALGQACGTYHYGDVAVTVHAGTHTHTGAHADAAGKPSDGSAAVRDAGMYPAPHVVVAGTSTLAGAVAPLCACVRNLVHLCALSPSFACVCASEHPADALRRTDIGRLTPGARADFVLLSADLRVLATYVGGVCVWRSGE